MLAGVASLRTLVRLGFHDCASAKCDGCIDFADPENLGLELLADTLAPICATHALGRADCWAAAAIVATEELSGGTMPMYFGRADAAICGPFTRAPEALFPFGEDGAPVWSPCPQLGFRLLVFPPPHAEAA